MSQFCILFYAIIRSNQPNATMAPFKYAPAEIPKVQGAPCNVNPAFTSPVFTRQNAFEKKISSENAH